VPRGGRREGAGRPPGIVSAPRRAIRAAAAEYATLALQSLANILLRAEAADERRSGAERPRDADVIAAAKEVLDRASGRTAPGRPPHSLVGTYDIDKLTDEQLHTVADILRLATPEGAIGDN
jgi:hypothetical protein